MRKLLFAFFLFLVLPSLAHSEGKYRAVVVGVAGFLHGYASLDYTARDARRVATALEDLGYSVSLLAADSDAGEVKYADVLAALKSAAAKSEPGDTLLFFFAGHGSRRMNRDYLLLSDSDPDKFDSTALAFDTLSEIVSSSKASKRVFVIDACRNSSRADGKVGFDGGKLDRGFKDNLDKLVQKAGSDEKSQTAVLYACSPGETSKESVEERAGIFTQRFVQALQQTDGTKPTTLADILGFVKSHMPATIEQTPLLVGSLTLEIRITATLRTPTAAPLNLPETRTPELKFRKNPKDGAEMSYIPAGEFIMGGDSTPGQHIVRLTKGYWMYRTDVTVAQYEQFCRETGRPMPPAPLYNPDWAKKNFPMAKVSWYDAMAYSAWAGATLPTEAQWERAARGPRGLVYPWGNNFDRSKMRCSTSAHNDCGGACAVASYPPNEYGLYDMAGNVWQWCQDAFDPNFYTSPQGQLPDPVNTVPNPQGLRIIRGGSFNDFTWNYLYCACRGWHKSDFAPGFDGFRCVIVAQ